MNIQQRLQTLQFQRCEYVARHRVGGIACDILGKLAQWESYSTARAALRSTAGGMPVSWHGEYRRRKQPAQAHGDGPRGHTQARDDTTTLSTDLPEPESRKIATQSPRCVHPPRWWAPPSTPTFPRQQAEKSPQNQHVLSFNPLTRASRRRGERVKAPHPEAARACGWDPSRAGEAKPIRICYAHPDRLCASG